MKRIVIALFVVAAVAVSGMAQKATTWEGYLADKMCGSKMTGDKGATKAEKHTKDCALEDGCKASGYGLVTGGKYVKFTDASDAKAIEYLETKAPESNIYVKVSGTMDGEKIAVTSIEKATKGGKKAKIDKAKGMHGGASGATCDCCKDGDKAAKHGDKDHSCGEDCMKKKS